MSRTVLAFDLGTGGVKAALYDVSGVSLSEEVVGYPTHYPEPAMHVQRPTDWWNAIVTACRRVLTRPGIDAHRVGAIALSGHSLGCIPIAHDGTLLEAEVPIWSDGRATAQAAQFFSRIDEKQWYLRTGNGFPAPLYTLFKAMWLAQNRPEIFDRTTHIVGTKDYINYLLTGVIATDPSYASGSGQFDLRSGRYIPDFVKAAGMPLELFPEIRASSGVLGVVLPTVATALGLPGDVKVMAGGVDNSCMALGACCFEEGDVYLSLGSSSWITVASSVPVLDESARPYVFAHILPESFVSATSIFSSGTSVDWVRNHLLPGVDDPEAMVRLAEASPPGSRGLIFLPSLGGGTTFEGGPDIRGGLIGLDLRHGRADIARATLEGVALGLAEARTLMGRLTSLSDEMLVSGGGAQSAAWLQILADCMDCRIVKTRIDRQASTLGAAALGFIGLKMWRDASQIREIHQIESEAVPGSAVPIMARARAIYRDAMADQMRLASKLARFREYLQ